MSTGKKIDYLGHGRVRETTFHPDGGKTVKLKKRGIIYDTTLSVEHRKGQKRK